MYLVRIVLSLAVEILFWLVLVRAILSWVRPSVSNPTLADIDRILYRLTEPILAPVRRLLPPSAGLDWSPLVVLLLLGVLQRLIARLFH